MNREIGMEADRSTTVVANGKIMERVELDGASPNIELIGDFQPAVGHFPMEVENQRRMPVVMLGNDVKERLFPGLDVVGKSVVMDGIRFEIVGVARPKGSIFGESMDNFVIIPIETYIKYYTLRQGLAYHALAEDGRLMEAQDEIRQLMRAWRHLRPKEDDNFGIFTADAVVSMWKQMTAAIAGTAVAIVSVFMVVGGVVIMNIMLAVVTERTYEIGIRKAVGARRSDILCQFLVESSLMAAFGGAAGVVIAWIVAVMVRNTTPVPMAVPSQRGRGRSRLVGRRWAVLRYLPGAAGGETRSHRGIKGRMKRLSMFFSAAGLALVTIREHKLRSFLHGSRRDYRNGHGNRCRVDYYRPGWRDYKFRAGVRPRCDHRPQIQR